ncbi:MAG TPA: AmmeMemoRadiSam system protein A [Candidatus Acidoferrales bacterium]|nr:AmmeMemoRadiSam system protein A [Candidatus Acidoferrales bacterium]
MSPLDKSEKQALLEIARKAIFLALTDKRRLEISSLAGALAAPGGAFVTLRKAGRLQGCIGRIAACEPLAVVVSECAGAAATEDPRFSRMRVDDMAEIDIEISLLSEAQVVSPEQVEPGKHGLIISGKGQRGVLLPQVAVQHQLTRERFLQETCRKAGLPLNAWQERGIQIETFTAEVFSDSDFRIAVCNPPISSE